MEHRDVVLRAARRAVTHACDRRRAERANAQGPTPQPSPRHGARGGERNVAVKPRASETAHLPASPARQWWNECCSVGAEPRAHLAATPPPHLPTATSAPPTSRHTCPHLEPPPSDFPHHCPHLVFLVPRGVLGVRDVDRDERVRPGGGARRARQEERDGAVRPAPLRGRHTRAAPAPHVRRRRDRERAVVVVEERRRERGAPRAGAGRRGRA